MNMKNATMRQNGRLEQKIGVIDRIGIFLRYEALDVEKKYK